MSANTVPSIIVEHKDRVSWIQLNRPITLNAVNSDIVEGLITGLGR